MKVSFQKDLEVSIYLTLKGPLYQRLDRKFKFFRIEMFLELFDEIHKKIVM